MLIQARCRRLLDKAHGRHFRMWKLMGTCVQLVRCVPAWYCTEWVPGCDTDELFAFENCHGAVPCKDATARLLSLTVVLNA